MELHLLKPTKKKKRKKRIGRGGKRGTYAGSGIKGQRARAGKRLKPIIRELIKRYPKLRGYRFKKIKLKPIPVNLQILEKKFKEGEIVNPKSLLKKGIISKIKGKRPEVKILAKGELKKGLIFQGCKISKSAQRKIKKAGGVLR